MCALRCALLCEAADVIASEIEWSYILCGAEGRIGAEMWDSRNVQVHLEQIKGHSKTLDTSLILVNACIYKMV